MKLEERANHIRTRIIEESYKNQTGHVGSCLSCVDILTVLFFKLMRPGDRFILSPGHKALALYATLAEKGILEEIDTKKLGGHPIKNPEIGIDFSTGSLGHGLSLGIGLAIANPKHMVHVLLSDGDLEEGSTKEAIQFMETHNVNNLMAWVDCNGWTAYKESYEFGDLPWLHTIKTTKGKGLPRFEGKLESHYWRVTKEDYEDYLRRNPA